MRGELARRAAGQAPIRALAAPQKEPAWLYRAIRHESAYHWYREAQTTKPRKLIAIPGAP